MWPVVAAVVLHVALQVVLNPWLNAPSDTKFWSAVVMLAAPLVFAVFALVRAIFPPNNR